MEYRVINRDSEGCDIVFGAEKYRKSTGFTGFCFWADIDGDLVIDQPVKDISVRDYIYNGVPYFYSYWSVNKARAEYTDIPDEIWAELLLIGARNENTY